MKRFALLFAAATLGLSLFAGAQEEMPGYSAPHKWYGGRDFDIPTVGANGVQPLYYRPTMRYYGNGFTVSYRYVPVYKQDSIYFGGVRGSSNFRTDGFQMSDQEILSWGANSARLTVKDPHSAAPRTAVTTIIRKKTTKTEPTEVPVITPR